MFGREEAAAKKERRHYSYQCEATYELSWKTSADEACGGHMRTTGTNTEVRYGGQSRGHEVEVFFRALMRAYVMGWLTASGFLKHIR